MVVEIASAVLSFGVVIIIAGVAVIGASAMLKTPDSSNVLFGI